MATDPASGDRIRKNGEIHLTVSKGPERYRVPQLAGLDLDAANRALAPIKLTPGQINEQYDETVPAGRVIAFNPRFNMLVTPDTAVNFVVSKGKKPIPVPGLHRQDLPRGEQGPAQTRLRRHRTEQYDEKVPEGKVISQTPSSGTLHAKDKVQLVVSKGPPLVDVPNVKRKSPPTRSRSSTGRLRGEGREGRRCNIGLNIVAAQNPGAGRRSAARQHHHHHGPVT